MNLIDRLLHRDPHVAHFQKELDKLLTTNAIGGLVLTRHSRFALDTILGDLEDTIADPAQRTRIINGLSSEARELIVDLARITMSADHRREDIMLPAQRAARLMEQIPKPPQRYQYIADHLNALAPKDLTKYFRAQFDALTKVNSTGEKPDWAKEDLGTLLTAWDCLDRKVQADVMRNLEPRHHQMIVALAQEDEMTTFANGSWRTRIDVSTARRAVHYFDESIPEPPEPDAGSPAHTASEGPVFEKGPRIADDPARPWYPGGESVTARVAPVLPPTEPPADSSLTMVGARSVPSAESPPFWIDPTPTQPSIPVVRFNAPSEDAGSTVVGRPRSAGPSRNGRR